MVSHSCRAMLALMLSTLVGMYGAASVASSADASSDLSAARQALNAALAAAARATAEYQRLRQAGTLSPAELGDYRTFLMRLEQMVKARCQTVYQLKANIGDTAPETNCERRAIAEQMPLSFPNEQTEGERVATLERRLGSSLSEFDEMLLREMEQLARTQSGSPDAGTGSGSGTGGRADSENMGDDESAHGQQAGDKARAATDSSADTTSGQSTTGAVREGGQTAKVDDAGGKQDAKRSGAVKRDDVPDAGDDDVVARQLREAAENETDPELREKLWEEYRRYKSGKAQAK